MLTHHHINKKMGKSCTFQAIARQASIFLSGFAVACAILLNTHFMLEVSDTVEISHGLLPQTVSVPANLRPGTRDDNYRTDNNSYTPKQEHIVSELDGVKILVAVASYDFAQIPHLEEVLDAYFDLCAAGSFVTVVVFSTIAWPVTLIDLFNTRFVCSNPSPKAGFSLTIHLKSPSTKLHLVDFHRELFYHHLDEYDLFIYTEDDIRVSPRTVAAYLSETRHVVELVGQTSAADYNVGITRYEYNYPPHVIIDDNSRHVTSNVTRVYWEHSWHPPVPKSVDLIPQGIAEQNKTLRGLSNYVHMKNHHQGMYLATKDLLRAWKDRKGCEFDQMKNRPSARGKPHQPAEGTQRVWMSSQQLYGNKHCNVQQVIPMDRFGAFTVWHLPNKNYRRVGRKGRMGGNMESARNMTEKLQEPVSAMGGPSPLLLTALQLHLELRKRWPAEPSFPYRGIRMEDHVQERKEARDPLLRRRMNEYNGYVERGGVLSGDDMTKTNLFDVK